MTTLDGYDDLSPLRAGVRSSVYSGVRTRDGRRVVIKLYATDGEPSFEARVQHEFRLLERLESPRVVRTLALEHTGDGLALIMDRHEGVNLEEYCAGQAMELSEFFGVARQLAQALAEVHEQRVIHRDLKPANILIEPKSRVVVLADFGISVLLEGERAQINDVEIVEGTLPYLSPEQTGRTNTRVDFRTDLYSLGVTFYELLTGQRPFVSESSLELLHAHLARRPRPPQELRPELPALVSQLVMRLLEKAPEERYQSARGLAVDLESLERASAAGESLDGFRLARHDVSMELVLPHQLYGREREKARLVSAFRRAAVGMPGMTVIRGPAGIGKSALLGELSEPVLGRRGFIARGKFDQGNEQPFSAVVSALAGLADQLLIETDENLTLWRAKLRGALGGLVGVIVELVPKFALVLGEDEIEFEDESLEIDKVNHRVKLGFARLLGALARPEHPLVLALDDLQWADPASCDILDELLDTRELALLVLGTTRDDKLARGHGVLELEASLAERGVQIDRIELAPLDTGALTKLVADVLVKAPEHVRSLVTIIARKTGSNPFFVRQFLLQLAELGLLRVVDGGWSWDPTQIESTALPEDSLAIMTAKLDRLEPLDRQLLATAAVLGGRFDVTTLLEVIANAGALRTKGPAGSGSLSRAECDRRLQILVDEGLVANVDGGFIFGHDRIREAAYSLSTDKQKRLEHLIVGHHISDELGLSRGVYATEEGSADSERWFELADHLCRGHGLLPLADHHGTGVNMTVASLRAKLGGRDGELLVEVNLRAGRRALSTGASRAALRYLDLAESMLGELDSPRESMEFEVRLGLGQAAGLCGQHDRGNEVMRGLLARPLEPLEYAEALTQHLLLLSISGRQREAILEGLEGLRWCGETVSREPGALTLVRSLASLAWNLRPARLERLEASAPIREPRLRAAMEIFVALRNITYALEPKLFVVLVARQLTLLARHGGHPSMPLVLMQASLVVANVNGNRVRALGLADRYMSFGQRSYANFRRGQAMLLREFLALWLTPMREQLPRVRRVGVAAHEGGDLESATFAGVMEIALGFYGGAHLRVVEASVEAVAAQVTRWGTQEVFATGRMIIRYCRMLSQGPVPEAGTLEALVPIDYLPAIESDETDRLILADSQIQAAFVSVVFGNYADGLVFMQSCAAALEVGMPGTWLIPILYVIDGLCAAGVLSTADASESSRSKRRLLARLNKRRKQLSRLSAKGCRFEHYAILLEAEVHAQAGRLAEAGAAFEQARELAHAQQNSIFAGIASERMALTLAEAGLEQWMIGPARKAREHYRSWGAHTKVEQLEARWPWLSEEGGVSIQLSSDTSSDIRAIRAVGTNTVSGRVSSRVRSTTSSVAGVTGSTSSSALDMATIFKAWQAISADIRLEEVVDRVMQIAVENAGADRGILTLANEGQLELVAEVEAEEQTQLSFGQGLVLAEVSERLPVTLLRWVARTREPLVLAEVSEDRRFAGDSYVRAATVRSVLCLPIIKRNRLVGLLYLENRLNAGSFTTQRLETLELLMSHAASAIENARLYEALRSSEIRWRQLVERLPDVVALLDRKGAVEFINLPLDRSSRRSLRRQAWLELVSEPHRERVQLELESLFVGDEAPRPEDELELELELELPGRGKRWYATRIVPIVVDGQLERLIVVAHDTTERRQREREKVELEVQLRQQQRLESIGTLASGVAHEINNPIQGIRGYAELIATSGDVSEENKEFALEIEHESKRVTTIVRNLLAFSRQEREQGMEATTVESIISETLSLARTLIRKDQIKLDLDLPTQLPQVSCRSQQIQQVVLNLITNARDALNARYRGWSEDKRIALRARAVEKDGREWVMIEIEDSGGGVPESAVEKIFDPFFTTKDSEHGTGLGLSVSHGIIHEHEGQLRLENHPGQGACFVIELPALARASVAAKGAQQA